MLGGFLSGWQTAAPPTKRNSLGKVKDAAPEVGDDDTNVLDENEGNIILSLIAQLRPGMELSRVAFPTFILEPRSMLERITDFMAHSDLVAGSEHLDAPEERFLRVLTYYLAGFHIKPKGVKKPYNPVLGEFFRCRYDYKDGTHGYYLAEQVSHHPPASAYFFYAPASNIIMGGEIKPKSKFQGNSVMTDMTESENRVKLVQRPADGTYVLKMPNMYARGILFGTMLMELGDTCITLNDQTGVTCTLDFKVKGYFSGTYNALIGDLKLNGTSIGEISGKWSHQIYYTNHRTQERRLLFDATTPQVPKHVIPESEQLPNESRRLWAKLTEAIKNKDMEGATNAKTEVEEAQREKARKREESGVKHEPKYFKQEQDGTWAPKITMPTDPKQAEKVVADWIWGAKP